MATNQYDEKIQKLFEEGKKLGAPGFLEVNLSKVTDDERKPKNVMKSTPDISELQIELDMQSKQASRLQQELNATRDRIKQTGQTLSTGTTNHMLFNSNHPELPSVITYSSDPQHLNLNSNNNNNIQEFHLNNEVSNLTKTKIHLENALEDSQAQVNYLTRKIDDMKRSMGEQKEHFRNAVEELQVKLQETVAGRKKLLDLRQHDMDEQEDMIHRLQTTLKELAASNQMQEQALLDAHERMEILENRNQSNEQAMTHIRAILASTTHKDAARSKSSRIMDSENVSELLPELLVEKFEKFITSAYEETDSLSNKLLQLEAELNATKQSHAAEVQVSSSETLETMNAMKSEHERCLNEEKLKRKNAQDQISLLMSELKELQIDNNTQTRLAADARHQVNEFNKQVDEMRQEHCKDKGDLQAKLVSLEYDLKLADDVNQRITAENHSYKQNMTTINTQLQQTIAELSSEREQRKALFVKESESNKEINDMRVQLEEKTAEIFRLREIAAQLRGDLSTKVVKEINDAENAERIRANEKVASITEENIVLREDLSRVKASLEAVERQLSDAISERSETMQMVKDKDRQIDRLTSQVSLSDRKAIEATEGRKSTDEKLKLLQMDYSDVSKVAKKAQSDLERARKVTDDKERISMQLRHQLETKTSQLKTCTQKVDGVTSENVVLKSQVKEQLESIENLNEMLKQKEETLAGHESRMNNLVQEKENIVTNVQEIEEKVSNLLRDKGEITKDLEETRSQLSRLIEERDCLSKELRALQRKYNEETEKLRKEIRKRKGETQQIQHAIRTVKNIDGKAAVVAANMQREVTDKRGVIDSLQTELSKVYDKLESEERENKQHKRECLKLQRQIDKLNESLKKSEQELRSKTKSERGYRIGVERLQAALEKAAIRNTEAQAVIDRQEAELSKAHIQRNLEMMDKRIPSNHLGMMEERRATDAASNSFGRPPLTGNGNIVLQNMLARILATMAGQTSSTDVTHFAPTNQHLAAPQSRPEGDASSKLPSNEIYKLLSEVRDHLSSQDKSSKQTEHKPSKNRPKKQPTKKPPRRNRYLSASADESSELSVVFVNSDVTSTRSEPTNEKVFNDDTFQQSQDQDYLFTSSPRKLACGDYKRTAEKPPSPVSMLLAGGEEGIPRQRRPLVPPLRNLDKNGGGESRHPVANMDAREKFVTDAISDNAEELCRQLQDRLEGLCKLGGKLEEQNRDAARLMEQQSKKMKRARQTKPTKIWR